MDNLSKKTVILLQIVVIVFIAILIKNLCINSSTTSQQEGFACEDSCASNRSSSKDGCFIIAPKGCPKKPNSFLSNSLCSGIIKFKNGVKYTYNKSRDSSDINIFDALNRPRKWRINRNRIVAPGTGTYTKNRDDAANNNESNNCGDFKGKWKQNNPNLNFEIIPYKCKEDINITDVNKLNPLECERRKHTYIKNCSVNQGRPENIKSYFYNSAITEGKTIEQEEKEKQERLEGIASQNNKIIFFSKPNYQGEVFSIDIPSRRTKGYFNKKTQRFVVYDALSKPPDFSRGPICIGSVIIPDNHDSAFATDKFRNIKLVLKDDDESNIDLANNITISNSNIGKIQATYYEISPRLDTLDTYTAKQVLEHNKRKIDGLNRILTTNIDELKENSIEKNETQQETINNMSKRISKNVDKIINNIGYRLINGWL